MGQRYKAKVRQQKADSRAEQVFRDAINREVKLAQREHRRPDLDSLTVLAGKLGVDLHKPRALTPSERRVREQRISEAHRAGRR
jgi:hypothetical protein